MSFNPNSPDTLGLEWFPVVESAKQVSDWFAGSIVACAVFEATATDTVGSVALFFQQVRGRAGYEVEVYDLGAAAPDALHRNLYRPAEDVFRGPFTGGYDVSIPQSLTSSDLYTFVDETVMVPGVYNNGDPAAVGQVVADTTWIAPIFGKRGQYATRFGSLAGTLAGRMITEVRLCAVCAPYSAYGITPSMFVTPYLNLGGFVYPYTGWALNGSETVETFGSWPANPETGISWRVDDVDELAVAASNSAGWTIGATGSSNNLATILQAWLEVEYADSDPRLACARMVNPHGGWNLAALIDPVSGIPGVGITAGHTYAFMLRQRTGSGTAQLRFLDSGESPNGWTSAVPVILASGRFADQFAAENLTAAFAISLQNLAASATLPDSQPYASIDDDVTPAGLAAYTEIYTGHTLEQEYTNPAGPAADLGFVRMLCAQQGVDAAAPLTVKLVRRSDDHVYDTATITGDDLQPQRFDWQVVEFSFASPPTVPGGEQLYLEWSTTAADGHGWRIQVASAVPTYPVPGAPPATITDAVVGAGVDCLTSGGVETCDASACATLATIPDTPTGFAAAVAAGEDPCADVAHLSWNATALGVKFLRYELDRSDDAGDTWQRIAQGLDEAGDEYGVVTFDDHEAKRNTPSSYRVRVRRIDLSPSDWSDTETVTVPMTCCGYVLTSNAAPELTVFYNDRRPRKYQPGRFYQEREFYNRDGAVVFRGLEAPLDRFACTLIIAGDPQLPAATVGRAEFGALEAVADADLAYVCVLDEDGNRWFAALMLTGDFVRQEPGGLYTADVTIRETTTRPYSVEFGG